MTSAADELDDFRYQHHSLHRGERNMHIAGFFWALPTFILLIHLGKKTFSRWRRRPRSPCTSRISWILHFVRADSLVRIYFFVKALWLTSLSPPFIPSTLLSANLGRLISIIVYGCLIASVLVSVNAPKFSPHFLDDVAFRAAWISLTQVPLVYLLATKRGPLNLLARLSYERMNWIHRWIGRILFFSATVHMVIMKSSISTFDIFFSPDQIMVVIRYGIGAYGMATWIAVTSVAPLRNWSYRAFYINHCVSTIAFISLLLNHVPSYARLPTYTTIGIIAFDWTVRLCMFMRNNISNQALKKKMTRFRILPRRNSIGFGHAVKMMMPIHGRTASPHFALPTSSAESTTIIRICDVRFTWRPGQHIRVYIPQLGKMEFHPFTPSNCPDTSTGTAIGEISDAEHGQLLSHHSHTDITPSNEIVLMIQARSGFTRRLAKYYSKWLSLPCPNATQPPSSMTAFVDGPFGEPPAWESYENLVLITSASGVSFALAVLDYLAQSWFEGNELQTEKIQVVWTSRHLDPQFDATVMNVLATHTSTLRDAGIAVTVEVYISCPNSEMWGTKAEQYDQFAHLRRPRRLHLTGKPPLRISNPDDLMRQEYEPGEVEEDFDVSTRSSFGSDDSSTLIDEDDMHSVFDVNRLAPVQDPVSWWWGRLSLPLIKQSSSAKGECGCGLIQTQLVKLKLISSFDHIRRFHGYRPDISRLVSNVISPVDNGRSIIAACGNKSILRESKSIVARINLDVALERRTRSVDYFSEGFS
ncbi:hypothetical protein B0J11DRAFT_570028, partial [Dendryphion nanum]